MRKSLTKYLTCEVDISYEEMPADFLYNLPEQIEILGVYITVKTKSGAQRKVDILGSIGESALIALEDDVLESKNI